MWTIISRRQALRLSGYSVAALSMGRACLAQTYPDKPIKLVVPFGPGGPSDVAARLMTQFIPATLGQPLVVENRPGAGGAIGSRFVAGSDPDGYTLLVANNATLCVVPALLKNPGYDPIKSFAPVAQLTESTLVFTIPNRVPANTVREFVEYVKSRPGKLSYASAGVGNLTQLVAEVFKLKTGTDLVHVPYKSGSEMVTAILSEQVDLAFPDVSILLPLVREKKLKALAVTAGRRHPEMPDVPTMVESGVPDFVMTFWSGIVAPAGTPEPIVSQLNAAINKGLAADEVKSTVAKIGAEPRPGSTEEFRRFVEAETHKWADIVRIAGLKPQ
jgi:tripartite-type tricarboxylate transporter receptor subunit TctC